MQPPAHSFALRPFPAGPPPPALRLSGEVARQGERLRLLYRLSGDLAALRLAPPASAPSRLDELWATTCFECFWAVAGERPYWELNASPAGHWNLYRLDDYRRGLRPQAGAEPPRQRLRRNEAELSLELELALPEVIPPGAPLALAIACVIEDRAGTLSYWALSHPGAEPDFHRRDAFLLRL